jgi:hypothetical protein
MNANDRRTTGDPFVSSSTYDFRLKASTNQGNILSSPFNMDMNGNTRGSDGVWDRGAYEYVTGGGSSSLLAPGGGSVSLQAPTNLRLSN